MWQPSVRTLQHVCSCTVRVAACSIFEWLLEERSEGPTFWGNTLFSRPPLDATLLRESCPLKGTRAHKRTQDLLSKNAPRFLKTSGRFGPLAGPRPTAKNLLRALGVKPKSKIQGCRARELTRLMRRIQAPHRRAHLKNGIWAELYRSRAHGVNLLRLKDLRAVTSDEKVQSAE